MKWIFSILILLTGCTGFFYHPDRYLHSHPKLFAIEFKELWFKSPDGLDLNAWYLMSRQKPAKGMITFFHGNAQNMSSHFKSLAWLTQHGYDIFIPDYRGYGQSDGKANLDGIYLDSKSILKESRRLIKKRGHKKHIVYGQSLGGVIATRALLDKTETEGVNLLVLDSTFMSYKLVAWDAMTSHWLTFLFSPLAWIIISNKYATQEALSKIRIPTLVIHSQADKIVPFRHGEEIYKTLGSSKKWFWKQKETPHILTFHKKNIKNRRRFLNLLKSL